MAKYTCAHCQHTIPIQSKYCMYCGVEVTNNANNSISNHNILEDVTLLHSTSDNLQRLHRMLERFKNSAALTDDVLEMECTLEEVHFVMLKYLIRSYLGAAYGTNENSAHQEGLSENDAKVLTHQLNQIFSKDNAGEYRIALEHYLDNDNFVLREPDLLTWLQLQLYHPNGLPVFTNTWTVTEVKTPEPEFLGFGAPSPGDIPF